MNYILLFIIFVFIAVFSLRYNWWRKPKSYNKARVLMYHSIEKQHNEKFDKWRVKPFDFEKQIKWLYKNGFKSYTISELCDLNSIPKKSVVITFDDGYESVFLNAFSVLKKYNFKATIYLLPNQTTNHWESKNTAFISNMLKNDQILDMIESGLIEFGAHTINHVNLLTCDNQKNEIENSKHEVEKITGKKCESFAYPYGKFDENIINLVKNSGFKNAVIVKRGLFEYNDNKFNIKRIGILGTESFFDFYLRFTRIRNKI